MVGETMPMKIVDNQLVFVCNHGEMHPLSEKDMKVIVEFFTEELNQDEVEDMVDEIEGEKTKRHVEFSTLEREWDNKYDDWWDEA